jgi:hypothetical protein
LSQGIVRALLADGACVNAIDDDGQTALMAVASEGRTVLTQLLLEAGADWRSKYRVFAETYPEYLPGPNENHMGLAHGLDGASALSLAKAAGHSETASALESWMLERGNDAEVAAVRGTRLRAAASAGDAAAVGELLAAGADVGAHFLHFILKHSP